VGDTVKKGEKPRRVPVVIPHQGVSQTLPILLSNFKKHRFDTITDVLLRTMSG
jgi:hypothetical protein